MSSGEKPDWRNHEPRWKYHQAVEGEESPAGRASANTGWPAVRGGQSKHSDQSQNQARTTGGWGELLLYTEKAEKVQYVAIVWM